MLVCLLRNMSLELADGLLPLAAVLHLARRVLDSIPVHLVPGLDCLVKLVVEVRFVIPVGSVSKSRIVMIPAVLFQLQIILQILFEVSINNKVFLVWVAVVNTLGDNHNEEVLRN